MRKTFEAAFDLLQTIPEIAYIAKDCGQIDNYETRPAVKFPAALIKVNSPRRSNLHPFTQRIEHRITIRLAFEKMNDLDSISSVNQKNKALEFYDTLQAFENKFQGHQMQLSTWECIATIDEDRTDYEVIRYEFSTEVIRDFSSS